jgi:hypothetical protein
MSVIQDRLSVITDTITSLDTQMRELERLRDQVKNAEQLVRKSRPALRDRARERPDLNANRALRPRSHAPKPFCQLRVP